MDLIWTRRSLVYVAAYLSLSGLGLFLVPGIVLNLFLSTGQYDYIFMRVTGAVLIVLATFVIQMVRYRLYVMYPTVIAVRFFLCVTWIFIYILTHDPMFLIFLAIVGIGVILSIAGYCVDRKRSGLSAPQMQSLI